MAYVISDECVSCGTCAEECPAEAIHEGDGKYVSTRMHVWTAEPAKLHVPPELSPLSKKIRKSEAHEASRFFCLFSVSKRQTSLFLLTRPFGSFFPATASICAAAVPCGSPDGRRRSPERPVPPSDASAPAPPGSWPVPPASHPVFPPVP